MLSSIFQNEWLDCDLISHQRVVALRRAYANWHCWLQFIIIHKILIPLLAVQYTRQIIIGRCKELTRLCAHIAIIEPEGIINLAHLIIHTLTS